MKMQFNKQNQLKQYQLFQQLNNNLQRPLLEHQEQL